MPFLAAIPAIIAATAEVAADVVAAALIEVGVGTATAFAAGEAAVDLAVSMGISALANGMQGSSQGVQQRCAFDPMAPRRLLLGKVWTAGTAMGKPITWGPSRKYAEILIAVADHECDGFETVNVDGYSASLGTYHVGRGWQILYTSDPKTGQTIKDFREGQPKFFLEWHNGADGQIADPWLVANLGPGAAYDWDKNRWDATAVGTNLAYFRISCYYDSDIFSGFPQFNFFVRGAKLYNPVNDSTVGGAGSHRFGQSSTYEWTANTAVMAYNVLAGIVVGGKPFYGAFYDPDDIPLDLAFAAINACDETVSKKAGGTVPRYHCGMEVTVTSESRTALRGLQEAMGGRICTGGDALLYAGKSQTPVFTFTDDDVIWAGDNSYSPVLSIHDKKNIFTGKFLDISQNFSMVDAPARYSDTDRSADGGIPLPDPVSFDQIQEGTTCQRLLEILRRRAQAQATATRTFGPAALNARRGQWIAGTSSKWDGTKWFEIVSDPLLTSNLNVTMTLREVPSNLSDWNPATDELDAYAISLTSAAPPDPLAATGISATPLALLGTDGSHQPGITVTFDPVDDPSAWRIVIEVLAPGNAQSEYFYCEDLTGGLAQVAGLMGGTTYAYRILLQGIIGRDAVWSSWYSVTTPATVLPDASVGGTQLKQDVTSAINAAKDVADQAAEDIAAAQQTLAGFSPTETVASAVSAAKDVADKAAEDIAAAQQTLAGFSPTETVASAISAAKDIADQAAEGVASANTAIGNAAADIGDTKRKIASDVESLSEAIAQIGLGSAQDIRQIKVQQQTDYGAITASYTSAIYIATGPNSALAQQIAQVAASVPSISGLATTASVTAEASARATADTGLGTRIDNVAASVPSISGLATAASVTAEAQARADADGALGQQVTSINSLVGANSASAIMQLYAGSAPSDATSRFVLSLSQNSGSTSHAAAFYMDATASGSRIVCAADEIDFIAVKTKFIANDGTTFAAFDGATKTLLIDRLPGLSALNSYVSSQLTNWWPTLSEQPSAMPSVPAEKFSLSDGSITLIGAGGGSPFSVNSASAAIIMEFHCTYKPQTSQQANVMAGFMRKNTSTGKYEAMDEATCLVSTGSNAIYNTIIARCRIPVGSYTNVVPWLYNISGNTISVRSVYVDIFQVSK